MNESIRLDSNGLSMSQLRNIWLDSITLSIDPDLYEKVDRAKAQVDGIVASGETVYGINTGFGLLAKTGIPDHQLEQLQRNLVLSHSTGVGEVLDDRVVRLALVLKIANLCRGHSGVHRNTVKTLVELVNRQVYPCIPSQGSVGASGDLCPLAHLTATLIGEGTVCFDGKKQPSTEGLQAAGIAPITLGPKEGLALLNGTQISTALALSGLFQAENLLLNATAAGALSVEAARGSFAPFDARVHQLRGQHGQIAQAAAYRALLRDSEIHKSHANCDRVQDPYCLRCQPQVMGACRDSLGFAAQTLLIEANAVTDNPLLFPDQGDVLSGGNFHAEPVAMAADMMAVAIAEIGALSERRIALLIDANMSGLPPFLVENSGLNSGFMIAHVTAASLASENKSLAHPASVDSMPTSANQEDHVSMATFAARRLGGLCDNVARILAIEVLAAVQGVEFHAPLRTSPQLHDVITKVRQKVPPYDQDRFFAPEIQEAEMLVRSGVLTCELDVLRF